MGEKLHRENPYNPLGGMNRDSNGISMKTNEAVDIVNCNITVAEVLPRAGTALLGDLTPVPTIVMTGGEEGGNETYYTQPPDEQGHFNYNADGDYWSEGIFDLDAYIVTPMTAAERLSATLIVEISMPLAMTVSAGYIWSFDSGAGCSTYRLSSPDSTLFHNAGAPFAQNNLLVPVAMLGTGYHEIKTVLDASGDIASDWFDGLETAYTSTVGPIPSGASPADLLIGLRDIATGGNYSLQKDVRIRNFKVIDGGGTILEYDFRSGVNDTDVLTDISGNGRHGQIVMRNSGDLTQFWSHDATEATAFQILWENGGWFINNSEGTPIYSNPSTSLSVPQTGWILVSSGDPSSLVISSSIAFQPDQPVIEYFQYYSPEGGTILFAFCADEIYRYDPGVGYVACWTPGGSPSLTQWSITNCIDRKLGATVVAAGSIYKRPGEIYTAASDRVLLYYDIITKFFVTFVCKTNRLAEHEYAEVISSAAKNTQVWDTPGDLPITPIVAGSAYLVAGLTGVIATAGLRIVEGEPINISEVSGYKWTQSVADTDEYHLEIDAGGDPDLPLPTRLTEDLVDMVFNATLGTLAVGQWGYGDNDALGYETIYIRLFTDTSPALGGFIRSFYATNNRLLPVDANVIAFGDDSFINLETGTVSIEWLSNAHNGEILYIFYEYELEVDYRPLYISNYYSALVFSNTSEALGGVFEYLPWRVRWSEQNNIRLFKEDYYQELALDDISPIIGMRALETEASSQIVGPLYFMKRNSIIRGTYNQNFNLNPDLPVPMFSFEIAFSEGMESTRTIVNIQGTMFYLGRNDVYMFDGVNRMSLTEDRSTGSTRVQKYIFDQIDFDVPNLNFGVYDEINRRYMLFLKTKADNLYATLCMVYDIDLQHWSRYIYPETSAGINLDLPDPGIIDDLTGEIDGLPGTIDSLSGTTRKVNLLAQTNESYFITSVGGLDRAGLYNEEFDSYFITRDFFGETLEEQDRTERVYIEGRRDNMTIGYSGQYDTEPIDFDQVDTITFGAKYSREVYNPDLTAIHARFMVTLTGSAEFRWMQVFSNRQEFTDE